LEGLACDVSRDSVQVPAHTRQALCCRPVTHIPMATIMSGSCTCPAALSAPGKVRGPAEQQDKGG